MISLNLRQYGRLAAIAGREAGLHMPEAKQQFVASRLQRCLRRTGIASFDRYLDLIESEGAVAREERMQFVSALTTNVTSAWREPHHFALLAAELDGWRCRGRGRPIAIWSAGCSSGEEPLSIAATCLRVLGRGWHRSVGILATDVDPVVLDVARARADAAALGGRLFDGRADAPDRRSRRPVDRAALCRELNDRIVYERHNLLDPAPEGPFDVIFCRNVTIYFSREAQAQVHAALRSRLAPAGLLAIGHTEQLLGSTPAMVPAGRTAFRRTAADGPSDAGRDGEPSRWP